MPPTQHHSAATLESLPVSTEACWLGVQPTESVQAALDECLPTLAADPDVIATLQTRGVPAPFIERAIATDLQRLAHAVTVLVDCEPHSLLTDLLPAHLAETLSGLDYRLDHVGREILCPPEPLLNAWHRARNQLGLGGLPGEAGGVTVREDLIFPSVQVVEAIRRTDPSVEAVTIAASFLCTGNTSDPIYIELFFPGHRDGSAAQHVRFMEARLSSLRFDPHRLVPPQLPICHLSVQVQDRATLENVHMLAQNDCTGLVTPYADNISINPGDGSHNTKMAVRGQADPAYPINVLEFIFFDT